MLMNAAKVMHSALGDILTHNGRAAEAIPQLREAIKLSPRDPLHYALLAKALADTGDVTGAVKQFQQAIYRMATRRPDALVLHLLNRIPLLHLWQRRLNAEVGARAARIIAGLGIPRPESIMKQYPHQLSGGMKQRIVIAIALACNPVLLIADEATSNLDVTIQAQMLELLRRLKQEEISSVLLITHDLGIVAETCDRVGVMYAGNLCEVADVKSLFQNPRHPYTRALLAAVPTFDMQDELKSIEGNVPNLVAPPDGCRFHPRCPHAMAVCKAAFPEMTEFGANHLVACYWAAAKYR